MAYRESFMNWFDKSKSEEKQMLESFANTCRNNKVSIITIRKFPFISPRIVNFLIWGVYNQGKLFFERGWG